MTQHSLFDTRTLQEKLFDYFLIEFGIILMWQEEYQNIATLYPNEYQQFLESIKTEQ